MAGEGSSYSWWYICDEDFTIAAEQTAVAVEENHSEPPPVAAPPALTIEDETAVAEEETAVAEEGELSPQMMVSQIRRCLI